MERPLALHISALSEAEYSAYSSIINDIIPGHGSTGRDGDWETTEVPLGEARGWIRGKYGVDAALLDQVKPFGTSYGFELQFGLIEAAVDPALQILRLFPAGRQQDGSVKLSQFLAVLRLISHARYGAEVDRALVFVQGVNIPRTSCTSPISG